LNSASAASPLAPALQEQLLREQVRLAIRETQKVRIPHTLVDGVLAWVAWQAGVREGVAIYLLVMTVSHLGRSALLQRLLDGGRHGPRQLMRIGMAALTWLGLVKAALTLAVFLQPPSGWQELFTMILVGNAAGAVATAAGHLPTYLSWAIPFGAGLAGGWVLHGGVEGALIALLVVALIAVLSGYVRDQGEAQRRLLLANEALREARDRAERASESRTRFFAAASHDLRQPLTALSYGAATVAALAQQRGDTQLAQVGASLRRALLESQGLLDSLLELSRLDAGAVEPRRQPLPLGTLLAELADSLQPLAQERGLQLLTEGLALPARVASDAGLLRRVLGNLLGNALKFTPPGGRVELRLRADGDDWLVEVIDNGPGIPAERQEQVFEEFVQLGNLARDRSQGLGLGLAIVRRLVGLLGLQLRLDSSPGQGCRFGLRLPRADAEDEAPAAPAMSQAALSEGPLRLLLVDDEAPVREALGLLAASLGWTLRCAATPAQALACLSEGWQPEALLLDMRLQGGASGLDLLAQLRQQGCTAPAWLITGETAPARIREAHEAGVAVLYKPVDGLALAQTISAALGRS
jgi:signal transduction histidine kinase/ActR/RegA family two-component response regulator